MLKETITEKTKASNHWMVIGSRGEGKTSLGWYLLELHHKAGRPAYVYEYPKPKLLPKWVKNLTDLKQLPDNACVLIDEGSQNFSQYSYQKRTNIYLRDLLTVARHKNQSYIFISLNTAFINLNFIYMIDAYILKQPTMFQRDQERKIVRQAYAKIQQDIAKDEFWYYDDRNFLLGKFKKPDWFTDKMSRAYSKVEAEEI